MKRLENMDVKSLEKARARAFIFENFFCASCIVRAHMMRIWRCA